ncbi:aminomethyl-transferring glycine dehydrogenase subunit GcvPA [Desulfobotulus sp. H1]|uniref:Probable glycine dehydrogenase (decarboxylating) subunit 1 n=1 Tax=Desulfobotulus pelophilus TaxID=2823377 RepID=A0ABT3NAE1_9BACT|nr:aminomethyl-transferring glycine dehydrogenase subunit GcvPA [Desulfobotulus pelophilus]MCW7754434.1 aminomethyl-transferring glycine dehydrogenase subunit GcvPA [Desulfobotulus pelophilus]
MRYLPHTQEDVTAMLETIGVSSVEDLFDAVPEDSRPLHPLDLEPPLSEWDLVRRMESMARNHASADRARVFLGAGSYSHHIPAIIPQLLGRSEFTTAYTPYQPEVSQGTLQAIFEYQTLTARLLGMDLANASMYDGASALAEALLMALRLGKGKKKVALSRAIHPRYREVVKTYCSPAEFELVELPFDPESGTTDFSGLKDMEGLAALAVQSPNIFGCIENLAEAANLAHESQSLLVAAFTEPLAFGLIRNPGSQGADIVCGEGQSFGIPQSFGGPGLGMFACRMTHVRNMPGRVVGETKDVNGERGFVLTLSTREQHIRREKATSNICSNQGLCATASAMYMAALGGTGIRELAAQNRDKAAFLMGILEGTGFRPVFSSPVFNEFVMKAPDGFAAIHAKLMERNMVAGMSLGSWYPELEGAYLFCATETQSREDMEALAEAIEEEMS